QTPRERKFTFEYTSTVKDIPADANLAMEVEALKRKVEELESQNRTMVELLSEIKNRLEATDHSMMNELRDGSIKPIAATLRMTSHSTESLPAKAPAATGSKAPVSAPSSAQAKSAGNSEPVRWTDLISEGNQIKFYGLLRLDLDVDSQRPNNGQVPFF